VVRKKLGLTLQSDKTEGRPRKNLKEFRRVPGRTLAVDGLAIGRSAEPLSARATRLAVGAVAMCAFIAVAASADTACRRAADRSNCRM
jgi:hypothetical protein